MSLDEGIQDVWKWSLLCWLIELVSLTRARRLRWLQKLRSRVTADIDSLWDSWSVTTFQSKAAQCSPKTVLPSEVPLAVVMQGPLKQEDRFTEETLRLYGTTFPEAQLILSTWDTEDRESLRRIEELGVTVLTQPLPSSPGPAHVNYQIQSTRLGLEEAKRHGATFAVKTRTDTRLGAANIGNYLFGLWQAFPVAASLPQRGRIGLLDLSTRLYIPNHASDILLFGQIDDLLAYWSPPLSQARKPATGLKRLGDLYGDHIPEVYLCESFLRRSGRPCERSLGSWWQVLAERFLVVDRASLGFFWPKYFYDTNHRQHPDEETRNMALCTLRDWINIAMFPHHCPVEFDALAGQRIYASL